MKNIRIVLRILAVVVLAGVQAACVHQAGKKHPVFIDGQYIVALKRPADAPDPGDEASVLRSLVERLTRECGGTSLSLYPKTLFGYAVQASVEKIDCIRSRENIVRYVEQDRWVVAAAVQSNPPWGLDRIDQEPLPLNNRFVYPDSAGQGVSIWVLDSGVNEVPDLKGRVACSQNFAPKSGVTDPNDCGDAYGHGTHVAGTAAGETYGVAKKAGVLAVRVLDGAGNGQNSWIIAGVDWVATKAAAGSSVANMSLIAEGGTSTALDDAVKAAIAKGIPFVIAAGNESGDACQYSPGDVVEALVVGAARTKKKTEDWRYTSSNQGACVDLFAPGYLVKSFWGKKGLLAAKTGTSCAAPHVTGAVALYLADHNGATVAEVEKYLLDHATSGLLQGLSATSPNKLLRVGGD